MSLWTQLGPPASMSKPSSTIPGPQSVAIRMSRLQADIEAHGAEIDALLKRNVEQAGAIGLQGTPAYLIGPFLAASALDYSALKQAVAKVRSSGKPSQ
jgi:protein-disulfide isomerase